MHNFNIHKFIAKIYSKCPFLGYIYSSLEKVEDNNIETIRVTLDNKLIYNPDFLISLDMESSKYILLHEALHKLNLHFDRAITTIEMKYNKKFKECIKYDNTIMHRLNIAMDLAINQLCDKKFKRPDFGVHLDDINKKYNINLEYGKRWEYYFENLPKDLNECENIDIDHSSQIESYDNGDATDGIENTPDFTENFNEIIEEAKYEQEQYERSIGKEEDFLIDGIIPINEVHINDRKLWESLIYGKMGSERINKKEFTTKRPNRRNKHDPYGKRYKTSMKKCVVVVDTSYSCIDDIPLFFGVVNRAMKKHKCTIDLILCTTNVYEVIDNIKFIDYSKLNMKIRSGGTDLTKAQEYIRDNYKNEGKGVNVIVITDGYTDWITTYKYNVGIIYTEKYSPLSGISNYAIINT